MKRREFITLVGGAAAWPLAAHGQQSGRIVRIGILSTANPRSSSFYQSFERRLRDLGHAEGWRRGGGVAARGARAAAGDAGGRLPQ